MRERKRKRERERERERERAKEVSISELAEISEKSGARGKSRTIRFYYSSIHYLNNRHRGA